MSSHKEKVKLLFNDLVVREDTCNFRCTYCLSFENTLKTEDNVEHVQYATVKNERLLYAPGSPLKERLDHAVDQFEKVADASILRISGGEILQIKGIFDFFKLKSPNYETIQILTNGYHLLQPLVDNLLTLGNTQVHMSIDGHNLDLNGYRVKKQAIQDRLLDNLDRIIQSGIPTEVGSVLTDRNIGKYHTFLDYMLKYEGKVTIYPFPVRGQIKQGMWPTNSEIETFIKEVVDKYDKYAGILAPKPFFDELCHLLIEGQRRMRCHVPAVMVQSFDDGLLTPCPNCWATELGNVLKEDPFDVIDRFGKDRMYSVFLWPSPRLPFCKQCFTSFDIINFYVNGFISDEDILNIPLYSRPLTWERLRQLKTERANSI
ncbi:radical SAM protein [Paenibacillus sp. NPDC057934]|uniref:radical SAM protein n=1 Tax=Paenibacillus sp. NPDC057934 TaxID=3346282 RepID=UPI0036DB3367